MQSMQPGQRTQAIWGYALAILCAGAALTVTASLRNTRGLMELIALNIGSTSA